METNLTEEHMIITQKSILCLDKIRKWTLFLLVFIFLDLLVMFGYIIGIILNNIFRDAPNNFKIAFIISAVISFFPILFLYRFSANINKSILSLDSEKLSVAFKNLKAPLQYIGILMIIILGICVLFGVLWLSSLIIY